MSEPLSDLTLLFTPPQSPSLLDPTEERLTTSPLPTKTRNIFYIELPSFSEAEKEKYKCIPEEFVASGAPFEARDVDQIIGEYRDAGVLYYYARFQDGIAHRYPANWFTSVHQDLVKVYEQNKAAGSLAPFHPAGTYIHPRSRIRHTIVINPARAFAKNPALKSVPRNRDKPKPKTVIVIDDSEPEEVLDSEEDEEEDDASDDSDYGARPSRRGSRATKKPVKTLPFSPKKRRAKKGMPVRDSDDEDDYESIVNTNVAARRSSRSTKMAKASYKETEGYADNEDDQEEDEDEEEDDKPRKSSAKSRGKGKGGKQTKKVVRGKASRPAYGNFRAVAELDYDAFSDEETAPLRAHRNVCEKCHRGPAHKLIQAEKRKSKGKGRKKQEEDEDEDLEGTEMERLIALGGWVRCLKCPLAAHWGCLAKTQQQEILKAAQDRDRELLESAAAEKQAETTVPDGETDGNAEIAPPIAVKKRPGLDTDQITEFICGSCMKGGICMGCMEVALEPETSLEQKRNASTVADVKQNDSEMVNGTEGESSITEEAAKGKPPGWELLFRCFTCKRLSHYEHLPVPAEYKDGDEVDSVALAEYYQATTEWLCGDCSSYTYALDKILAWRPYPSNVVEPSHPDNEPPNSKLPLPREYLVKWADRSYRRTQWVPHMWLVTTHGAKLKNFLNVGAKVELLAEALPEEDAIEDRVVVGEAKQDDETAIILFQIGADADPESTKSEDSKLALPSGAAPDAERRIPPAWKTIDRVLDVLFWCPEKRAESQKPKKQKGRESARKKLKVVTDEDENELDLRIDDEFQLAFDEGEQPSDDLTETVSEWEYRFNRSIEVGDIEHVVWAFIKWNDLVYEEATWDSPPREGKFGYSAFERAFSRFVDSRRVQVMKLTKDEIKALEKRPVDGYKRNHALDKEAGQQPVLGQNKQLSLMPFQIDGVNWLCDNWWRLQHCILADEMGLGKTVQIVTFLGTVIMKWKAFPALVVVPNSTITNWVREFEKWAPNLRVVPFYGEAKSREIIKKFELLHETKHHGTTGAKFHVLVTTYETLNNPKDFTPVFKSIPRWEVLVVDEGQRLKNDSSLLFRKLNELNSIHRIIMTGTPLNNNMRELFNLMNFLDPQEWRDLEGLEKEHAVLTEDLIKQLHERLRPYFLRRIKSEVLQLPPKNEVIVPVSMAPLQKEVYRSLLSKNLNILKSLSHPTNAKVGVSAGKLNNLLMQLRKCLQHPYLIDDDIEPRGLSAQEAHDKLIDGSTKLRFLKSLLPQLKARGHRVLLFSQFVIGLNIVEDFLHGEGFKYLRLDGNTQQAERQKGMDEFNKPDSDVFVYLLTTRAGGVGINLWSADTVIIFDPDFNPHQDLQAIARAHRYGQKKTCLVFKLMVKESAEEKIMQTGKKKLVLDHLIVQKMDEDDSAGDDVQSILTYGAKALFEEGDQGVHDIIYTDHDIEKLIEKTEQEGDQKETEKEGPSFSFAKIWAADKDSLEEMDDTAHDKDDSWAQTLTRIAAEREKVQAQEITGRGVRRRAAALPQQMIEIDNTPVKHKKSHRTSKSKSAVSDESDTYTASVVESDKDSDSDVRNAANVLRELDGPTNKISKWNVLNPEMYHATDNVAGPSNTGGRYRDAETMSPVHDTNYDVMDTDDFLCSLCGLSHGDGACYMTESSQNLAEYRQILILHADDEPMDERAAAIRVIDETLYKRGKIHLIDGQPLHLLEKNPSTIVPPPKKSKHAHASSSNSGNQYSASNGRIVGNGVSSGVSTPGPTASSSKRGSPPEESSLKKKKKLSQPLSGCPVCERPSHHLVKDCPTVLEGSKSISKAIKRLQDDPSQSATVTVLGGLLKKQKRRELAAQSVAIPDE